MWDEQERFANVVARIFIVLLAMLGVALAAASLVTGILDYFFTFLILLGVLAAITLAYGLVAVTVGGVLIGMSSGATYCFHWVRNRWFN